jgi:hypothetical protein
VIALVLASKDMKLFLDEPGSYINYGNLNIGRILAIIGITLSILMLLVVIFTFLVGGDQGAQEFLENLKVKMEQASEQ